MQEFNKLTTTTKQEQPQLKINLDQQFNPRPELVRAYKDANVQFLDLDLGKAVYQNEARVFQAAKVSKKPVKHSIQSIYRKRVLNKEYVWLHEHLIAFDYFNNEIDFTREILKWERPIFKRTFGINPASLKTQDQMKELQPEQITTEILNHETVYEYEFKDVLPQLKEWFEQKLISEHCNYYAVESDGKKYSVKNFQQFTELSMDDLVLLNIHSKKYAGVFQTGELTHQPIDEILQHIRAKIKAEISITTTK